MVHKVKKEKPIVDMTKVNNCLALQSELRGDAGKNKTWAHELPLLDCLKALACLTPQSYGGRIEEKLCSDLGLIRTDDPERGDRKSFTGKYIEFKCSIFTSSNTALNLVQIRPWQDTGYIYAAFDMRDLLNIKTQLFYLDKSQMESELVRCKVSSAHGTKKSNINNTNKEVALRIEADSDLYKDWVANYGISEANLAIKLNVVEIDENTLE